MGDRPTRACQALGQEDAITRGSPGVLLAVDDQYRRVIQAGCHIIAEGRERSEQDGTRQQAWARQEQSRCHDGSIWRSR